MRGGYQLSLLLIPFVRFGSLGHLSFRLWPYDCSEEKADSEAEAGSDPGRRNLAIETLGDGCFVTISVDRGYPRSHCVRDVSTGNARSFRSSLVHKAVLENRGSFT
ncbi:F-box associated ubiquitination effector family protein [Striga asiatica]|uniref:F-box associated ubiquitination effector family protein n=1 Tax=Striga asiatica TaxID=4170 RepID=A0A5A7QVE1_STRAF|nr:F-box associated ubiquitination effector family protein [Striga asiatica]